MSVELKIELTGAVVYVRQAGIGGEKVAALLLGRSKEHAHHMPLHRPTFVFDPDDVAEVTGLPAQIIHTAKHKLGLQVDMTGFDLVLGEESGSVVVGREGSLPFTRVVDFKHLVPAGARLNADLIDRFKDPNPSQNPELVAGRLFLQSGLLYAVGPVAPEQANIRWRFTYKVGEKEICQWETLTTDRVAFRYVLPGDVLHFVSWSGQRKASIQLQGHSRVTARLACTPGLSPAGAQGGVPFKVAANDSHFEMAYDIFQKKPENEPIPHPSPEDPHMRVPGKNCFKAAQIVA